jgi:hypothetical protein
MIAATTTAATTSTPAITVKVSVVLTRFSGMGLSFDRSV